MKIKEAIEKSIGAGFKPTFGDEMMSKEYNDYSRIFLDQNFWKCLGIAMGWEEVLSSGQRKANAFPEYRKDETNKIDRAWARAIKQPEWLFEWHRMIDILAGGGTIDGFFNSLDK